MNRHARVVTVFGCSRPKPEDVLYAQAQALGVALAENGLLV
jgi:predicted Rossmann-fold nucleotide-binding protein